MIQWNSIGFIDDSMGFNDDPWNSMIIHGIQWISMESIDYPMESIDNAVGFIDNSMELNGIQG